MFARRTIQALNANPLYISERAALKQHVRPLWHWVYLPIHLLLLAGLLAAAFPVWFYITTDYTRLLAAFGVVIFAGHFVINTRTLIIATRAMAREFPPDRWQTLISGDLDARQIVRGKWWAVVRHVWHWHLLTGIMKAGLALALAQHIHDSALRGICSSPFQFLCYSQYYEYFPPENIQPALYKGVLALLIVVAYSLLEPGLMAALGFVSAVVARRRHVSPVFVAAIVYMLMAGIFVAGAIAVNSVDSRSNNGAIYYGSIWHVSKAGVWLTAIIGLPGVLDGGMLASTNLLRPYEPSGFNTLRSLTSAAFGLITSLFIISGSLRFTQRLAVQFGAARPAQSPSLFRLIRRWLSNPATQAQQRLLRRQMQSNRWLQVGELGLFGLALPVTWLSRWVPLDCSRGDWLYPIVAMVYAVHAIVGLRTLIFATGALDRETENATWDMLVLSGIDARQIILGKWWAVIRSVWIYHVLAAALKLGLVYALAQYLMDAPISPAWNGQFSDLERTFHHLSSNFVGVGCFPDVTKNRYHWFGIVRVFRWGVILSIFALLEAVFLTTIGLSSGLAIRKSSVWQLILSMFLRTLPILTIILVWQTSTAQIEQLREQRSLAYRSPDLFYHYIVAHEAHSWQRLLDTAQIALSTQVDGGIASVNLVSPSLDHYYYNDAYEARQYAGLIAGMGLYLLLILITLRAAEKIAIRRGALPPP